MKQRIFKEISAVALAMVIAFTAFLSVSVDTKAASYATYTNAAQICNIVYKGYNGGKYGPITITQGTLKQSNRSYTVHLVTLSGTENVSNQTTGYLTDALAGFNLNNKYLSNAVNTIMRSVPAGSRLVIAGHSLGGMVGQQIAANSTIKNRYVVMNTITFGSPLLAAGSREGTVYRLGDTSDIVPYLSGSTINNTAWAIAGLNRENGGYGKNVYNAHVNSYLRSDVWGRYDVVGKKYGGAVLTLNLSTMKYYKSTTYVK